MAERLEWYRVRFRCGHAGVLDGESRYHAQRRADGMHCSTCTGPDQDGLLPRLPDGGADQERDAPWLREIC